jgi:hypothetical protein
MVFEGALVHVDFVSAVEGSFGQPAATEVALAVACAFASAAGTAVLEVPDVTVRLLNLEFCCVAAAASTFLFCAVRGTGVLVLVLVVELEGALVDSPVTSTAEPRRQATRYVEPVATRAMADDPRDFGGVRPACTWSEEARPCKSFDASAVDSQYSTSEIRLSVPDLLANCSWAPSGHPVTLVFVETKGAATTLVNPAPLAADAGTSTLVDGLDAEDASAASGATAAAAKRATTVAGPMPAMANFRVSFLTNTRLSQGEEPPRPDRARGT